MPLRMSLARVQPDWEHVGQELSLTVIITLTHRHLIDNQGSASLEEVWACPWQIAYKQVIGFTNVPFWMVCLEAKPWCQASSLKPFKFWLDAFQKSSFAFLMALLNDVRAIEVTRSSGRIEQFSDFHTPAFEIGTVNVMSLWSYLKKRPPGLCY